MNRTTQVEATRLSGTEIRRAACSVVHEGPLLIRVNRESDYVVMRTPGQDRELAVGFLFTEGMINGVGDILTLMDCPDAADAIEVRTATPAQAAPRNLTVNSSCGLCGRADVQALIESLQPVRGNLAIAAEALYRVPDAVRQQQELFQATGATHAAALFDGQGNVLVAREDVGRHNALDKVIGHALLTGKPTAQYGVFLSGRTSLEMIVKAARADISLVAAVSAPTEAALTAARRANITLCGFLRGTDVTVYSHEQRLTGMAPS